MLGQLQTDPAIVLNQNGIDEIAVSGLDIWNTSTTNRHANSYLLRKSALHAYAAHASTQHNNERLVKLGALMASTGKSEIMVLVFVIASNDFMQEYHKTRQEPANQPAEAQTAEDDNNGPQRRKRGNRSRKKKLFDLQRLVLKKEQELQSVAVHLGPEMFLMRSKSITRALTSKEENLRERIGQAKSGKLMACIDENKPPNARQRRDRWHPRWSLGDDRTALMHYYLQVQYRYKEFEYRVPVFDRSHFSFEPCMQYRTRPRIV
jgi:hypothetical protein